MESVPQNPPNESSENPNGPSEIEQQQINAATPTSTTQLNNNDNNIPSFNIPNPAPIIPVTETISQLSISGIREKKSHYSSNSSFSSCEGELLEEQLHSPPNCSPSLNDLNPTPEPKKFRPLPGPITGLEYNKYLVSQTFPRLIAAKSSRGNRSSSWPEFLLFDQNELDFKAEIGDQLSFKGFRDLKEEEMVNQDNDPPETLHLGISPQSVGPHLKSINTQGFILRTKEIISKNGKPLGLMALVQTDFSPIPNFVQINPNNKLTVGSRIGVICKSLQIGTVVFENHILPQSFPVAPMASQLRKRAGPSTTFAIELTEPAKFVFPFNVHRSQIDEINAQKIISASLNSLTYIQNEIHESTQITTKLIEDKNLQNVFIIYHTPKNLRALVTFRKVWEEDSPIIVASDPTFQNPIAQGTISEIITARTSFKTTIRVHLRPIDTIDEYEWDYLTNKTKLSLQVPYSPTSLIERANSWASLEPQTVSQSDTPQGILMQQMLGIYPNPPITNSTNLQYANFAKKLETIPNTEQLKAIDLTFNPTPSVVVALAPPGTGKSRIISQMVIELSNIGKRPIVITHSNLAMSKIVEDVCPKLSHTNKQALILLSARAKEQYMNLFNQFSDHLLMASITDTQIESAKSKDRKTIMRYKDNAFTKPKQADEKSTALIILELDDLYPIKFSTVSMCEEVISLITKCTHLFLDEATQTPINQILHILTFARNLEKIFLAGDALQLGVHLQDVPKFLHPYCFESILTHTLLIPSIPKITLRTSYRSHPILTRIISDSFYGSMLESGTIESERAEALSFPFPIQNIPLLLVHTPDKDTRDSHSFSRHNISQTQLTKIVAEKFISTTNLPIVILGLYKKQVEEIRLLNIPRTTTLTIDSYQAREQEIVILITTKTIPADSLENEKIIGFINDSQRVAVSISRARQAFCIIGDFNTLLKCSSWQSFINQALKYTYILNHNLLFSIQDNSSASVQNNSNQQQHKHIPTITSRQPPPHKKQYRPYPLITPLNSIKCSPKINQLPPYFSEYPPHNPTPINKYSSIQSNMYPTIPSQNTMHHPKIQKSFIPSPMPSNFPQPTYPTIPSTSFAVPRTNINIQYFNNNYWQWSEEDQKWIKVPPPPPQ